MYPVLFELPYVGIPIPVYGVVLAIAVFLGIRVAVDNAVKYGLDRQLCTRVALRGIIAGLIGAKLLMVFMEWSAWSNDWQRIFSVDFLHGGGVYYGGFLSALAVSAGLALFYKLPGWTVADAFAPGIALGQAIGRLACFAAGCCWGTPTTSWVGVEFTALAHEQTGVPIGVSLHPTQLYESCAAFVIFLFLMRLRSRREYQGQVMLAYISLYATARFIIEFYRGEETVWIGPLTTTQLMAIILAVASGIIMVYRRRFISDPVR